MSVKRIVDTAFWEDDKVMTMFSPEDKLFFLYLMTNPHTTQVGVYRILTKQMAFELGYTADSVEVLLDRFENKYGIIRYSRATMEVAIKNYLRYSVVKGGKPLLDLLIKEAKAVRDKSLLAYIAGGASESENETVRAFLLSIAEVISNNNTTPNDNVNVNDNENDDSYHDSYHESYNESYNESYHDSSPAPTQSKPVKHKHGEYGNVMLTDEDLTKLKQEYPHDWDKRIERLSSYIASTGKTYKSHLATIRNWARMDKEKGIGEAPKSKNRSFTADNVTEYEEWGKRAIKESARGTV